MSLKSIIILVLLLLVFAAALFVWPWINMAFVEHDCYTQSDKREYDYYTPDLLKKMPRVSNHFSFCYTNISGPQAFVYGIQFDGTTDLDSVQRYLSMAGYARQQKCHLEAECWRSGLSDDVVTLSQYSQPDVIKVEVYRSNYH